MGEGEGCKCDRKIFILEKGKNIFTFINACSNILLRNKSIN